VDKVHMKWKSWNITAIQVGSGESRTSVAVGVPESKCTLQSAITN
jgi:hypothetical protein